MSAIQKKLIAIFGGSFNPPTKGHRDIGLYILKELRVDEFWYLVSPQNPFKTREDMADFAHRVAMTRLNAAGNPQLQVQDIEAKYAAEKPNGIIRSAETLRHLATDFPDHRFVWIMGADNFVNFHMWGEADYIARNFPIVVIQRKGSTEAALSSPSASYLPRVDDPRDLRWSNGWYLSHMPPVDTVATLGRNELRQGKSPECVELPVANYALTHQLYRRAAGAERREP